MLLLVRSNTTWTAAQCTRPRWHLIEKGHLIGVYEWVCAAVGVWLCHSCPCVVTSHSAAAAECHPRRLHPGCTRRRPGAEGRCTRCRQLDTVYRSTLPKTSVSTVTTVPYREVVARMSARRLAWGKSFVGFHLRRLAEWEIVSLLRAFSITPPAHTAVCLATHTERGVCTSGDVARSCCTVCARGKPG